MRMDHEFTAGHQKLLRDQAITDVQPGTVLHDFGMLLDFLGPEGVEASGKYNLLPLKSIEELDRGLSRPLNLEMKRPQLRSHPYLHGLNLLLRASGLTQVVGAGGKARLVLDPEMLMQWNQLNATERYFNLLEAWLRFGRPEMIGEQGRWGMRLLLPCVQAWRELRDGVRKFDAEKPAEVWVHGVGRDFYMLGLMEMFGLIKIEQPPRGTKPWVPAALERVPFGDAFFGLIAGCVDPLGRDMSPPKVDEDEENDEAGDEAPEVPRFGGWQPRFQPYFPEWHNNLEIPQPEPQVGTFIFRVSLGKIWRLIAIPGDLTLDDLVDAILRSMRFDSDHLYEFSYRDRFGKDVSIVHPAMEGELSTDCTQIGTLPLEPGHTMKLLYDFGDSWPFAVKLERIEPRSAKAKTPRILQSHGKAPAQYSWDD